MIAIYSITHSAVDVFAGGRSNTKVYLFLIYFLLLISLTFFLKKSSVKIEYIFRRLIILSIFIGYILGIVLFGIFTNSLGVDFDDYIITFNNGEISSTQLSHNHILKGAVGIFLQTLGMGKFENIDAGLPFLGIISPTWLWVGFIVILIAILSAIIFFSSVIPFKGNPRQKIFYALAFALSSFAIIKAIPDGGLFLNKTIPILISFLFIIRYKMKLITSFALTTLYILWCFIVYWGNLLPENYTMTQYLISGIIPAVIISTFYYISTNEKFSRLHFLLTILIIIIFTWPVYNEVTSTGHYNNLSAEGGLVALYKHDKNGQKAKYEIGQLKIFEVSGQRTIHEILKKEKVIDNIYPIAVPWQTCIPTTGGDIYTFNLITSNIINTPILSIQSPIKEYRQREFDKKNGYTFYEVTVTLLPCMPRHLNILQELLKEKFSEPFFIYNFSTK